MAWSLSLSYSSWCETSLIFTAGNLELVYQLKVRERYLHIHNIDLSSNILHSPTDFSTAVLNTRKCKVVRAVVIHYYVFDVNWQMVYVKS
jgi:hypothetical protein